MWFKLINLIGLIGATVWLSRAPDWEPAIAVATLLLTLIGQEWHDSRLRKAPAPASIEHDKRVFAKYEQTLPEATRQLEKFLVLSSLEEGRYIISPVQDAFEHFVGELDELSMFISTHFFTRRGDSLPENEGDSLLMLYPELKYGDREIYEAHEKELQELINQVEGRYLTFRRAVKEHLAM
jgi:hypothetical protein